MRKRWPLIVAAVVVVGAAVVVGTAASFDPATQRDRITQAVRRATGRELTIAGPLRIGWGWSPVLDAEDVSLANAQGGSRPQMVVVARVEARVKLLPLLSGKLEIASVTLVRPDIVLETDANGRGNWQFDRPAVAPGPANTSSPGPRLTTQLDSLRVELGRMTWRDGSTGQMTLVEVPSATLDLGSGPAHLLAQAETAGADVKVDAAIGTWAQMTAPGSWPVKLAASVGDATVSLDGRANPAEHRVTGRLLATVPDLARFGAVMGRPGLPPLKAVHLAATLSPELGGLQDVLLEVGPSDLGGWIAGATLGQASLTWPAGQAARLVAEGGMDGGPWHLTTQAMPLATPLATTMPKPGVAGLRLSGLALASPLGDVAGDVSVQVSPRFTFSGAVTSTRLDADAIRNQIRLGSKQTPVGPAATPQPAGPAAPVPPAGPVARQAVFLAEPLPWAVLRRADFDLYVTAATIHWGGADYHGAAAHLALLDGVARIEQASATTPAGRVDLSASADARLPAPPVAVALRSAGLSLDAVLQAAGLPGGTDAQAELDVVLHAAGASPHALVASLAGHAGLAVVDGEISNAALGALLGGVVKQAGAGLEQGGRSRIRCLAVRADVDAGIARFTTLKLDTTRIELDGSGTVDLGAETMALHLRPLLRLGGAGVSAPLRVEGGWRAPVISLDPTFGRTGFTLGGLAGPPDTCAAELSAARDGRSGTLPASVAENAKMPKPADLLRSFLR